MMPVGRWVMRTAESVVLTCWPPEPEARIVSMRMSSARDLDVDLFGLRQHGDGRRRGVDAPAGLGRRHALHAVHAGFELQMGEDALARNGGDDFLEAADLALAGRERPRPSSPSTRRSARTCGTGRRRTAPPRRRRCRRGFRGWRSCSSAASLGSSRIWMSFCSASMRSSTSGSSASASSRISASVPLSASIASRSACSCSAARSCPDLGHHVLQLGIFRRHASHRHPAAGPADICASSIVETLDDLIHTVAGQI